MPSLLTGLAGSRHNLIDFFILWLHSPFSCLQLETFSLNLGNAPLFLWTAFKMDVYCVAAYKSPLISVFNYSVCLQPRSLRLWVIMFLCFPFSSTQLKPMMKSDSSAFRHSSEGRALLLCAQSADSLYLLAPKRN